MPPIINELSQSSTTASTTIEGKLTKAERFFQNENIVMAMGYTYECDRYNRLVTMQLIYINDVYRQHVVCCCSSFRTAQQEKTAL